MSMTKGRPNNKSQDASQLHKVMLIVLVMMYFNLLKKKRRDHDINCHVPMLSFNGKNVTFLRFISIKRGDLKNNLQYVIE